jgi:hypothetical protein
MYGSIFEQATNSCRLALSAAKTEYLSLKDKNIPTKNKIIVNKYISVYKENMNIKTIG